MQSGEKIFDYLVSAQMLAVKGKKTQSTNRPAQAGSQKYHVFQVQRSPQEPSL